MYVEHIRIFGLQLIDEVNRSCFCVLSLSVNISTGTYLEKQTPSLSNGCTDEG